MTQTTPDTAREAVARMRAAVEADEYLDGIRLDHSDALAILALNLPAPAEVRKMQNALEIGEAFLRKANSAWACGEPLHRVRAMLDAADAFQAALDEVAK